MPLFPVAEAGFGKLRDAERRFLSSQKFDKRKAFLQNQQSV